MGRLKKKEKKSSPCDQYIGLSAFAIFAIHTCLADLEKAASGASSACGHFVGNHAILITF